MSEDVLIITPQGTLCTLWFEGITLRELGRLQVERASEIEFDPESQSWTLRMLKPVPPEVEYQTRFDSREEALAYEREMVNTRLLSDWST